MRYRIKRLDMFTGYPLIAVLNRKDADLMDIYSLDRIRIRKGSRQIISTLDTTNSDRMVPRGTIGVFSEAFEKLGVKNRSEVHVYLEKKPESVALIKKKLKGERLKDDEILKIVKDISNDLLNDIEIAYFVSGCYIYALSFRETVALTKAMVETGKSLKFGDNADSIVLDKHCIGGVAGNRTSPIVVSIIAAAGLIMPKTSSRSITSAAGTADTVEVFCKVNQSAEQMQKIVKKTNACLVWGGSLSLAPSDDKIIRVEHPLSMDPTGQLIASILAKKKSISASHVLIDIPVGKGAKIENLKDALRLKKKFSEVANAIGLKTKIFITDGSQPIGNGIGPLLEAREVLYVLMNSSPDKYHSMLKRKCLHMSGNLLELCGKVSKGQGYAYAKGILESGKAFEKFTEIVKAQQGRIMNPDRMRLARFRKTFTSKKSGKILHIDNRMVNRIARIAGAPHDKEAGIYLYVHKNDHVTKGDKLFTLYSDNRQRLEYAENVYEWDKGIEIGKNHDHNRRSIHVR